MDILDQAIEMEIQGEAFYREIAADTVDPSIKIVLNNLANEEIKHRKLFEYMKAKLPVQVILSDIKPVTLTIFQELKAQNITGTFKQSVTDALQKAEDIEIKSYKYYRDQAKQIQDPAYQDVIKQIADEEEAHASIVLDLLNYYLEPKQWLEDAEWNHHDEY